MRMTMIAVWVVIAAAVPVSGLAQDGDGHGPPGVKAPTKATAPKFTVTAKLPIPRAAPQAAATGPGNTRRSRKRPD
jgi:hypothetical protein